MTTFNLTCEAVEATLADYLDGSLQTWVRESIEEHLGECVSCTALAREIRHIAREAASLPALVPEHDPWRRVADRIGAPVAVSEPVAESAPLTPIIEPIVFARSAAVPIGAPSAIASEPPLLPSDPLLLPSEALVQLTEPPVLTTEPPVLTTEPPVLTTEPLARVSEPPLPPGTSVPTTAPAIAFPGRREKLRGRVWLGLAAAALLLVTAGTTFLLTVKWLGSAGTPNVASDTNRRGLSSTETPAAELRIRRQTEGRQQVGSDSPTLTPPHGQPGSALTVSAISAPTLSRSPEDVVYDKEINVLQRIVRRQKAELDTSTVAEIEKNLRTLDSAIAQIRAALKKDPGSSLLDGQASRALEMKVELLRRTAMLRSNT